MADGPYVCDPNTDSTCIRPVDGFGGSLYDIPFQIPVYNSSDANEYISFHMMDLCLHTSTVYVTVVSIGLAFCILTVANILILTPSHKRKSLYHILLAGNVTQIIHYATTLSLYTSGYLSSSYLLLSGDWISSDWSLGFRATLVVRGISGCVAFACVYAAFFSLSHGLLAGLRLRYSIYVYYTLMGVMAFVSLFTYFWKLVLAVDIIRFIALQEQGDSIRVVTHFPWYQTMQKGAKVLLGLSMGLWSALFIISAATIIRERRKALFWLEDRDAGDFGGKRRRVLSVYERALQVIAIVALESFIVPLILCILVFLPNIVDIPQTDGLIVPTIFALLPVLSLFNGGNLRTEIETGGGLRPN